MDKKENISFFIVFTDSKTEIRYNNRPHLQIYPKTEFSKRFYVVELYVLKEGLKRITLTKSEMIHSVVMDPTYIYPF